MGGGDAGRRRRDRQWRPAGHRTRACLHLLLSGGRVDQGAEHADKVLELYNDEKHRHLVDILNHDPKTTAGIYGSICTWVLGYPDRALRLENETDAHARRRGHPFDLGYALTTGAHEFDHRCGPEDLRKRAEECERLGRENSLPPLWTFRRRNHVVRQSSGKARSPKASSCSRPVSRFGRQAAAIPRGPTLNAFLAEAMVLIGDLDNALRLIDEQIAQIERPGWGERHSYAEILRLKGWMLSLKGDLEGAERNFLASLDWARRQQAKSWDLRTSTSLARLWQSQGKRQDAYDLLAPVYGWFTEGFDTKDLQDSKALLDELTS